MVDQGNKEKERIFYEKNQDFSHFSEREVALTEEIGQLQHDNEMKTNDIENYVRILNDNDSALKQLSLKLKESELRTVNLSN